MSRPNKAGEEEFLNALYQGGELLAAGKVIEAKDHLEKAYQLQPKNEKGQNLLGLTYFKLGLFDRAAEIYEALVRENPADPTLRVNLGLVYLKTNALPRAIREFETSTDLAPEHKKAQNYLGVALAQAGDYGRAREHFLLAGSDQMAEKMARAVAGGSSAPRAVDVASGAEVPTAASPPPPAAEAPARAAPPMMLKRRSAAPEESATNGASPGAELNGASHAAGVPIKVPLPAPVAAAVDGIGIPTPSPMNTALADRADGTPTGDIVGIEATDASSDPGEMIGVEADASDPGEMIGVEADAATDSGEMIGVEANAESSGDAVAEIGSSDIVANGAGDSSEMVGVEASAYQVDGSGDGWSTGAEVAVEPPPSTDATASEWASNSGRDARAARVQAAIDSDAAEASAQPLATEEIALSADDISDGGAIAVERTNAQEAYDIGLEAPADIPVDVSEAPAEVAAEGDDVAFAEPESAPEPPAEFPPELPPELPPEPGHHVYDLGSESEPLDPPPAPMFAAPEPTTDAGPGSDEYLDPEPPRTKSVVPPNFAESRPTGAASTKPPKPLEVSHSGGSAEALPIDLSIAELGPKVALFAQSRPGPFQIDAEAVAIAVQGEVLTRILGMVAQSGQLEMELQNRKFRGKISEKPFGEGEAQLMRVRGRGRLVVQLPKRTFVSVELGEESGYFLENAVFAFEEALSFENGRVPSEVAPDLELVHLRGKGRVLLNLAGAVRSLEVADGEPVTVPLSNLIGWHGNLSPRVTALAKDRNGKALRAGVELSGEGFALLSVASG